MEGRGGAGSRELAMLTAAVSARSGKKWQPAARICGKNLMCKLVFSGEMHEECGTGNR
jgi:hypothetical protein